MRLCFVATVLCGWLAAPAIVAAQDGRCEALREKLASGTRLTNDERVELRACNTKNAPDQRGGGAENQPPRSSGGGGGGGLLQRSPFAPALPLPRTEQID